MASKPGTKAKMAAAPHMLVGYMRVSTDSDRQVLDLQHDDALVAAGR